MARNRGCELASGEFIAFLDADDLWVRDKLALQCAAFDEDPALDLVWGQVREFDSGSDPQQSSYPARAAQHPGTLLMRRTALRRVGKFSEHYQQAEVVEWAARLLQLGLAQRTLPQVLMYRRLHDSNKGLGNRAAHREYLQVLKRHMDRKKS